jgi:hypothetical protein
MAGEAVIRVANVHDALMEPGPVGRADDVRRALSDLDRRGLQGWIFEGQLDNEGGPLPRSVAFDTDPTLMRVNQMLDNGPNPDQGYARTHEPWPG